MPGSVEDSENGTPPILRAVCAGDLEGLEVGCAALPASRANHESLTELQDALTAGDDIEQPAASGATAL